MNMDAEPNGLSGEGNQAWERMQAHRKRAASRSPVTPPSIQIRWGIWVARSDLTFVRGSPHWFPSPSGVLSWPLSRVAPGPNLCLEPPARSPGGGPFPAFRPGPRRGPSRRLDVPTEPGMKQPPDFDPLCASRRDPVQSLWIAWDSRADFPEKSASWTCPQVQRPGPFCPRLAGGEAVFGHKGHEAREDHEGLQADRRRHPEAVARAARLCVLCGPSRPLCPKQRQPHPPHQGPWSYFARASRRSSSSSHSSSADERSSRAFSRAALILSKPARSRA